MAATIAAEFCGIALKLFFEDDFESLGAAAAAVMYVTGADSDLFESAL